MIIKKIKNFFKKIVQPKITEENIEIETKEEPEEERVIRLIEKDEIAMSAASIITMAEKSIRERPKVIREPLFEKLDKLYYIRNRTKKFRIRKKQDHRIDKIFRNIDKKIWTY